MSVHSRVYATHPRTHETIYEYTLDTQRGLRVVLLSYGCTITHVVVPDAQGRAGDVVLGFDTLPEWIQSGANFNSIVGRYANRIAKGKFKLNGVEHQLATNNGPNHLHGGPTGFFSRNFALRSMETQADGTASITLQYVSADGEEGYPGRLTVDARFTVKPSGAFVMDFSAVSDKDTIVNLCNHAYWNLSGDFAQKDILAHSLVINADACTPVDHGMIPTGDIAPVKDTHMDFTTTHTIGERIHAFKTTDPGANGGYDHNYVLNKTGKTHPDAPGIFAASLVDPKSHRVMDIYTTAPAIQLYVGNFLTGVPGKKGEPYHKHAGLCLETQVHPDSPNREHFPSPVLRAGETYRHVVTHVFSVNK